MKVLLVAWVTACGSSSSAPHTDAKIAVRDAPPADTAAPDVPEPVAGHYHFVISQQQWPATTQQARDEGFDLDGNQTIDNQFGMVTASLGGMGFDFQATTSLAIASGTEIVLADLGASDLTNEGSASFTLFAGANPQPAPCNGSADTTCGHHLHGTGSFTVDPASPQDVPLVGSIANGQLTAGPGQLTIPFALGSPTPASITLLAARVRLTPTAGGFMTGTLGGAISVDDRDQKLYPAIVPGLEAAIARDCMALQSPPQCGCASGSQGAKVVSVFDTDPDCTITTDELKNNSLIMSLFAPDVMIGNQPAISVGFAVTAVDAVFTP